MHECPNCGSACYCGGDIDDCESDTQSGGCSHCLDNLDAADWLDELNESDDPITQANLDTEDGKAACR